MTAEPRCMYYDVAWPELQRLGKPRRDGLPGKEYHCDWCGGIYSIKDGGRPAECKRPAR